MQLNAVFHRKEPQFEPKSCVVEKIIELDPHEYAYFMRDMQRDQDFIADSNDAMWVDHNGTEHCLLVLNADGNDGVLINSEGSSYARRACFVPGARQLLKAEEQRMEQTFTEQIRQVEGADLANAPAWTEHARGLAESTTNLYGPMVHNEYLRRLRELGDAFQRVARQFPETAAEIFNRRVFCQPGQLLPAAEYIYDGGDLEKGLEHLRTGCFDPVSFAADKIIEDGLRFESDGVFHRSYADVQEAYGLDDSQMPRLFERLEGSAELEDLLVYDDYDMFTLCFRQQEALGQRAEPLTQEGLEAMYARHLLWELEQPEGVRADFSEQVLSRLEFEGMPFQDVSFAGATIHLCRMGGSSFDGSDFSGARLRGVNAFESSFGSANFGGAVLEYCGFAATDCGSCDFSNARLEACDFTDAFLRGADFSQAELSHCEGLEGISQGMAMRM